MLRLRGGAWDPDHGMYVARNNSVSYTEAWGKKKKKKKVKLQNISPIPLCVMSLSIDNDVEVGYGAVEDASWRVDYGAT